LIATERILLCLSLRPKKKHKTTKRKPARETSDKNNRKTIGQYQSNISNKDKNITDKDKQTILKTNSKTMPKNIVKNDPKMALINVEKVGSKVA
jgi:hypothetical protein